MDSRSHTGAADMEPLLGTDSSNFIPWSPSNEFFGQQFNTASPFSPNEFLSFCNALSMDAGCSESKQDGQGQEQGNSMRPAPSTTSPEEKEPTDDHSATDELKSELSKVNEELRLLRQEMDGMRAWLDEVSQWNEATCDLLAFHGFGPRSPQGTCLEPGCTCQYEADTDLTTQSMEIGGQ